MKIGFSKFGYGTGHEPSPDERRLYRLAADQRAVIMNPTYRLTKIDATDDPAFDDAWIC